MKTKVNFVTKPTFLVLALAAAALGACDDLTPPSKTDAGGGPAVTSHAVGGVTETEVNASSTDAWIYFDFDKGADIAVGDPLASADWDVAFQRFKIKSNGGVSGAAGNEVAWLADTSLADVTRAPATGWVVDRPDGDDENMDPDFGFNVGDGWYSYDPATHALAARKQTYVVMTHAGTFHAVQLLAYYDAAGSSGHLRLQWKRVDPPAGARVPAVPWVPIDARPDAAGDPDFDGGGHVSHDAGVEPDASAEPVPDAAVDQAVTPVDSIDLAAGIAGTWVYRSGNPVLETWYDYDPVNHGTKPKPVVFVVQTAGGGHAKLQVLAYEGGTYRLRLGILP